MATTNASAAISQSYFDEVCLENAELFDCDEEEALQEALTQLKGQNLSHISKTHPSNVEIRTQLTSFLQALRCLLHVSGETPTSKSSESTISEHLTTIQTGLARHEFLRNLFIVESGFSTYCALPAHLTSCESRTIEQLYKTLLFMCSSFRSNLQTAVEANPQPFVNAWMKIMSLSTFTKRSLLWKAAFESMRRCEANKREWMKTTVDGVSFPRFLMDSLRASTAESNGNDDESSSTIGDFICEIVTSVCTFDDFTKKDDKMVVQSGHAHVQLLLPEDAVDTLHNYLVKTQSVSAIRAIRSMAISNTVVTKLQPTLAVVQTIPTNDSETATAILGLWRNVAANDDMKLSIPMDVLIDTMTTFSNSAKLQEHGAGCIAAIALRQPAACQALLLQHNAGSVLVSAMRKHHASPLVQRQCCLAIRNLVSRTPELRPSLEGAKEALLEVSARHLSCQDEVFAALRDLGHHVTSVQVVQDENGVVLSSAPREAFGEAKNSSFRPVFESSL